uniref:glycosyltransferase n=1 Tax=Clostridium sp. TaxID=1506 RepID=UPI00345519F4
MDITVICPLYKAGKYINSLHKSLLMQKKVDLKEVKYILTDTKDGLEKTIETLERAYLEIVTSREFSHSLVREKSAYETGSTVIVFITQDIIIEDEEWLYKFTKPIFENKCEAAFSRQICDNNSIERYTRIKNYPQESRIVTLKDTDKLGVRT